MKSHVVFGQHSRKHISYYQDTHHAISSFNINSFSPQRNKKSHDKSAERQPNSQKKTQKKNNHKESVTTSPYSQLKQQLKLIMNDAKFLKGFCPPRYARRSPKSYENEKIGSKKQESPHNQKQEAFKPRTKQDMKNIKIVGREFEKKRPTWLSEKAPQSRKIHHKNEIKLFKKSKSKQNKSLQSSPNRHFQRRKQIFQKDHYKIANNKSSHHQKKDWKRSYDKLLHTNKSEGSKGKESERMSMSQAILQKQIIQLKFQLEIALEDNNILLNRIEVLNMELASSNRKLDEWRQIEVTYRNNEKALKQTILNLENKLITSRESKNRRIMSDISKFYDEGLCDRSILAKKNEEISRLNELIIMNRKKVSQAHRQIQDKKINSIKLLQNLERKYKNIIDEKDQEIEDLKEKIDKLKEELQKKSNKGKLTSNRKKQQKPEEKNENYSIQIPLLKNDLFERNNTQQPYV